MSASTSDSTVDPVEQLLDLFLYAPIGFLAKSAESVPDLAKRGRTQAANARVIGQFALGTSNTKARKAFAEAEQHVHAFLKIIAESAAPSRTQASPTASSSGSENNDNSATLAGPIENYDTLTAVQILPLLATLPPAELQQVSDYEHTHRARKTILTRIRQLQG
ncbi:MAG: hypothetical protein NT081_05695 [Actinobacteria bacterium]|nr:hypothetical protein [Actinomycetota bacterium]